MQPRLLNAAQGWAWARMAYDLFRRSPALLGFLVFGFWFLFLLLDVLPFIGPVLAAISQPALQMAVMNGCRAVERGERTDLGLLFSGFRRHPRALLSLGGLNFVAWICLLFLSSLVDDGALMKALTHGNLAQLQTALNETATQFALGFTLLLMVPLLMAFWFAPMLVAWDDMPPSKAIFFSFFAAWRNGRAFFGYGMATLFYCFLLPGAVMQIAGMIADLLGGIVVVAFVLYLFTILVPCLAVSIYVSFHEVFATPLPDVEEGTPPAEGAGHG